MPAMELFLVLWHGMYMRGAHCMADCTSEGKTCMHIYVFLTAYIQGSVVISSRSGLV